MIEGTKCSCRTRAHRDDDLFIHTIGTVTCCEHTRDIRRTMTVDEDFTEFVAFHRITEPVRVRHETDLDEDAFQLNVLFDACFTLDIRDAVYFIRPRDFLRLGVCDDRDVRKTCETVAVRPHLPSVQVRTQGP